MKKVIFFAHYPDDAGNSWVNEAVWVQQEYVPLFPSHSNEHTDLKTQIDKVSVDLNLVHCDVDYNNLQNKVLFDDAAALSLCDIVVIDLDTRPGTHFFALAVAYKKPVIAVSEIMTGIPPYFAPTVRMICRRKDLAGVLNKTLAESDL